MPWLTGVTLCFLAQAATIAPAAAQPSSGHTPADRLKTADSPAIPPLHAKTDRLTLGVVSAKPEKKTAEHQNFVDYLTRHLFGRPELKGKVIVVPTALQLAQLLVEAKIDFFMESPYPTHVVTLRAGSRPILRRWKHGTSEYRSVIFTRKDSAIQQLNELLGKTIVFEDADSTSGYFLPKSLLARHGFTLREKSSLNDSVAAKEIGFVFAGGVEKNIRDWVLSKKAAAGAFSNEDLDRSDSRERAKLQVLAETDALPRHLVSVRRELPRDLEYRLQHILLGMHAKPEGLRILKKTDNTTKFDLFNGSESELKVKLMEIYFNQSAK